MATPSPDWVKLYLKNGRTFSYLRRNYPLTGIGFFCELLMLLANTPGHHIRFTDDIDRDYLLDQMHTDEATARELIGALVLTGKVNAELWAVGVVYMQDAIDSLSEYYRRKDEKPPLLDDMLLAYCRQGDDGPRLEERREEKREEIKRLRQAVGME